jgi:hypothetical protein
MVDVGIAAGIVFLAVSAAAVAVISRRLRKSALIGLGCVLVIGMAFGTFALVQYNQNVKYAKEHALKIDYESQNNAFWGVYKGEYMPYQDGPDSLRRLQLNLNAYHKYTGNTLNLEDVKVFLQTTENSDGSPRTYLDGSETIRDYVEWYGFSEASRNQYRNDLDDILFEYQREHPDKLLPSLYDMTIEQLNELDKKLQDPSYDLNLG